jgi:tetratricopeptide (TPR) repeat protein
VCVGGCTVEAAQAIAGPESKSPEELLDLIAVLVDHSLVNVRDEAAGELRLGFLEVVREYGRERLAKSSEEERARERHAHYFLQLAEAASAHLIGSPQQGAWLQRLERDRGNLIAALDWARDYGDHQLGLRLVAALGPFWYFRGYISEGRHWIDTFLAASASDPNPPSSRIWLLYGAGKLALEQGDYVRVTEVADQALALAQALDDSLGMSQALELQGSVARVRGDPLGARALLEQSLLWGRRAGDRVALERVLFWLGHAAREAGDLVRAELAFEELLLASRQGPLHGTALLLLSLGQVARERVDDQRAAMRYREALEVFATIGDPSGFAACFEGLAGLARQRGDMERTTRLAAAASGLRESAASALTPAERRAFDQDIAAAWEALGDAAFATLWSEGRALPLDDVVAYARE